MAKEESKKLFIRLLAEGKSVEECISALTSEPYLLSVDVIREWFSDPEILKQVVDLSNNIIEQAWGTMWSSIKKKAMLGSIQHSKLLIEFVTNGRKLADNKLRLIFDSSTTGNTPTDPE